MAKKQEQTQEQNPLEEFKKSLEGKSREELIKLEEELVKQGLEVDKELAQAQIALPKKNYEKVAVDIRYFVDKQTIQWKFASAMVELYNFWDPKVYNANIPYPILHQTLNILGGLQFTGYDEWTKVVDINEYFKATRDEYVRLTTKSMELLDKHGVVVNMIEMNTPLPINDDLANQSV